MQQRTRSATPQTNAILVLGMHRSGTSAVARVLNLMGAYVGETADLLPAHAQDNPSGYWERTELVIEHDRFLESQHFAWNRIAGYAMQRLDPVACQALQERLRRVIESLNSRSATWLIKDPRLSLLLPLWLPLLDDAACVVVIRDPREIASSMRNTHRGVMTSQFPLLLWEKYLRTLLGALDGRRALFVGYPDLLANPAAETARLLGGLRKFGVAGLHAPEAEQLSAFLDARLQRSEAQAHVQLSPAQTSLYEWLRAQCAADGAVKVAGFPQTAAPDAALAEFEAAFDFHVAQGRAQADKEATQRLGGIEAQLVELRHEHKRITEQHASERSGLLAEHASERTKLLAEHAREREQLLAKSAAEREQLNAVHAREQAARHAELAARQRELDRASAQARELTLRLAELQRSHAAALADAKRHAAELDETRHARNTTAARLAETERHAAELDKAVAALRASWSWKLTAPLRGLTGVVPKRSGFANEQRLYRLYYAIPGVNPARKRALIEWLHRTMPWLTRRTLSYQLYTQALDLRNARAQTLAERERRQRMDEQRAAPVLATIENPPLISIVMPVYNVEARWLQAAVDSVRRQFYPHWELCIADDASTRAETKRALRDIGQLGDQRIRIRMLDKNAGIAGASNAALEMASGEYIGLLDHDDVLARDALLEMARCIRAEDPDLIYSDEDKLDFDGNYVEPHFKSDFNPDYFFSINYICHFTVLRRALVQRIGGFRTGFDGSQDYDLFLRATEHGERVAHIPKVLYHWRKTAESTAAASGAKPKASDAGRRALAESLQRRGIDATVEPGPYPTTYSVRRKIVGAPLVSILIPFRDKPELLSACVNSLLDKTDYPHFEVIGIDNGSSEPQTLALMETLARRDARVRFVRHDVPFNFSAINNFGARQARGEHLLFLNNDTEVIAPEWLRAMLEHSQRPEVGVVGAKLLYTDRSIQHAGVIVGIGGVAGHAHLLHPPDYPGYFARAQLPQNLSAVTFACAMTRRDVFERIGGLNERELTIAFNDIDYCLRAREAGYLVVYTPLALLFHHESRSRGYEDNPEKLQRFAREIAYMRQRHDAIIGRGDPYYNPQLSLTNNFQPDPRYADELPL